MTNHRLLTTVGQDYAVFHEGYDHLVVDNLEPDSDYELHGHHLRTLPDLGRELSRFVTVNDVHFGETVCGLIEGTDMGPVFSVPEGEIPYPEFMNAAAITQMSACAPDAVLVKGDLTSNGTDEEYQRFLEVYGGAFGDKLFHIRGNHEAYNRADFVNHSQVLINLPGVTLAMIDTSQPGVSGGTVYAADLDWLESVAASATTPVLVFGHHHIWDPAHKTRSENYFGIQPDQSEQLIAVFARHTSLVGYFAGHTHRNRVQRFPQTGDVPFVEVAAVKEFPGMFAEYKICEQGILQINHRLHAPEAMAWSEKTSVMYKGAYFDYAFGGIDDRCYVVHRN